MFLMECVAHV